MRVEDEIYGEHEITEPVLIELINSKPVQRLKGINQAGALKYTTPHATVTRYEHSIGVLILLRKLGADLTEQIAGLLHDVPHTAFSHVIDYALQTENHDFHEQHHERIIRESDIPEILGRYGIDIEAVLDEQQHTLLEQPAPQLCADRIDYTLRDTHVVRKIDMRRYVQHLDVHKQRVVFTDAQVAFEFSKQYIQSDKNIWASPRESAAYELLAEAIRTALDTNIIDIQDLWMSDDELFTLLQEHGTIGIKENLAMLNEHLRIQLREDGAYTSNPKMRYINPYVKTPNGLKHVTELHPELLITIREHRQWHGSGQTFDIQGAPQILLKSVNEQTRV